jgi:hypothetical protein
MVNSFISCRIKAADRAVVLGELRITFRVNTPCSLGLLLAALKALDFNDLGALKLLLAARCLLVTKPAGEKLAAARSLQGAPAAVVRAAAGVYLGHGQQAMRIIILITKKKTFI